MAAWTLAYLPGPAAAASTAVAAGATALRLLGVPGVAADDSQQVCCRHMQMASAENEASNRSGCCCSRRGKATQMFLTTSCRCAYKDKKVGRKKG
jgi:hypothetical protein